MENHIASERKIEVKETEAPAVRVNSEDGMTAGSPMNSERIDDYKEHYSPIIASPVVLQPKPSPSNKTPSRPQNLDGDEAI